jgi:hypothetical protein
MCVCVCVCVCVVQLVFPHTLEPAANASLKAPDGASNDAAPESGNNATVEPELREEVELDRRDAKQAPLVGSGKYVAVSRVHSPQ